MNVVVQDSSSGGGGEVVYPAKFREDEALLRSLKAREPGAAAALYDKYGKYLLRVLARVMGNDQELSDLLHEVFVRALDKVHTVREGDRLKAWLTSVAVFTARGCIRHRQRRRWLGYRDPDTIPEMESTLGDPAATDALRRTYSILESLPADQRIPFALRVIDGMSLIEVAEACSVSLATIKRRLSRAEHSFVRKAQRDPVLCEWVERHPRWRQM